MAFTSLVKSTVIKVEPEFECFLQTPTCLSFVEPLVDTIQPEQVAIFTGGDSWERRQSGFSKLSADTIIEFAGHHGYGLAFLDQLNFTKPTVYKNVSFTPHWHRIFALDDLRQRFSSAKYFLWMDDDILVPYKETDALNHWINLMEKEPEWEIMYAAEVDGFFLNSGMFIFKNHDFAFNAFKDLLELGVQKWASTPLYEQSAMVDYLRQPEHRSWQTTKVKRLNARDGPYTFNSFYRCAMCDEFQFSRYRPGDAFAHFLGTPNWLRDIYAVKLMEDVQRWRQHIPSHCRYPINSNFR